MESLLGEEVNCRKNDLFTTFLDEIWVFDGGVNRTHVRAPIRIIADRSLTFRALAYINVYIDRLSTPKEKKRHNKIKTGRFYLFGLDPSLTYINLFVVAEIRYTGEALINNLIERMRGRKWR